MDLSQANRLAAMALEMSEQPDLTSTLNQILVSARDNLGCQAAGVLLVTDGDELQTAAATDDVVREADALQATCGEGPWRASSTSTAAEPEDALLIPDLAHDLQFPRWSRAVAALGFSSLLSIRLFTPVRRLGALNLYGHAADAFSPADAELALIFGRHASVALTSAQNGDSLRAAVASRHLIGQAQGILMERYQVDADRAFEVLRRYSQHQNIKLRVIAEKVINQQNLPD